MKQLTKKQRHKVYKEALNMFVWTYGFNPPVCSSIDDAVESIFRFRYYKCELIKQAFPELGLFEPEEHGIFWFDDDYQRNIVLMFCVAMSDDK